MNADSPKDEIRPLQGVLPCPFCGCKTATTYPGSTFRWRYVGCDECGAQSGEVRINTMTIPRPQAIAEADPELLVEWNRRAPLAEVGAHGDNIAATIDILAQTRMERDSYRKALEEIINDPDCDGVQVAHEAITPYTTWKAVRE